MFAALLQSLTFTFKHLQTYFGKPVEAWRPTIDWKYFDWMGWHEQGDGKWFLGINVEQGRIKNANNVNVKLALAQLVNELDLTMVLSPSQDVIFKDILPEQRERVDAILKSHGILAIDEIDPLTRLSIACPALPLCGLAVAEAERRMPEFILNFRGLLTKLGLGDENVMLRMTGCPNG